ncbi:E3 ubiquitin-protein ligase ATL4-like [Juglans regia]|uniref:E3 ubiquitin-protein ligase ATL4-like n=2 Tax=Juglans regia TaxID=51240 RepID=A0A2I4EXI4_JUGRE|nr:E3 ubiquitin-protein ligase ATL4-like [Juglans regia]
MGSFVEESSGLIVTHLLYKVALIIAVARWVLCWALRLRDWWSLSSSAPDHDTEFPLPPTSTSTSTSTAVASSQMIRDNLVLTTLRDLTERLPENGNWDTCAVCLNGLSKEDEIRELRNCCHVFHRECIDRWVDGAHDDNHTTCPLCRAPLLTSSQFHSLSFVSRAQPSWAVERLLYLFGDDLLF